MYPMRKRPVRAYRLLVTPADQSPLATLEPDYLSLTIDTSLLLGGNWWGPSKGLVDGVSVDRVEPLNLDDKRLLAYAKALAPAMLRIGGTEADHVRYKSGSKAALELGLIGEDDLTDNAGEPEGNGTVRAETAPDAKEYRLSLGKGLWKRIHHFVDKSGFRLFFTVAAGPSDRDASGAWNEDNLARLAAYSVKKGLPVAAWELGNEVNAFAFIHGLSKRVSPAQYGRDFARFGNVLRDLIPRACLVGPASAVWPRIGEPYPLIPRLASGPAAGFVDAISWHYYPQQSSRGKVAVRRAGPETMLSPRNLDEVVRHCRRVNRAVARASRCKPSREKAQNWLTESAHALYGGEPGVSDRFASTLWWLDELALLAREGVSRVFRQSLIGSDYGLLREKALEPTPDYFASVLWKRIMGAKVYRARCVPENDRYLRVYAHRNDDGPTILAINLDRKRPATLVTEDNYARKYALTGTEGILSKTLSVNGVVADDGLAFHPGSAATEARYRVRELTEREQAGVFEIPPLSALFLS